MTLIKYNPARLRTHNVSRLIDDLFNDSFFQTPTNKNYVPQVDVSETTQAFELSFSVPGVDKKDITIDIQDGVLTVSGNRKFEDETKDKNYHSVESKYGEFKRAFQLPDNIDAEKVAAHHSNGILNITVPKDEKKVAKKTVEIS